MRNSTVPDVVRYLLLQPRYWRPKEFSRTNRVNLYSGDVMLAPKQGRMGLLSHNGQPSDNLVQASASTEHIIHRHHRHLGLTILAGRLRQKTVLSSSSLPWSALVALVAYSDGTALRVDASSLALRILSKDICISAAVLEGE